MKKFFLLLLIPFVSSLKLSRRSGDCKSSNKCTRCQGHCTDDTQCGEPGKTLKCYKRGDAMNQVPGCEVGEPAAAGSTIYNYCYEVCPSGAELSTEVGGVGCKGKIASVLKAAPGSCDGTQDGSLDIWVNTAVAANEIYDILTSNFKVAKIESDDGTIDTLRTTTLSFNTLSSQSKINGNNNIAANSIGTTPIMNKAVTADKIADWTITGRQMASNSVGSSNLIDGAVTNSKIGNRAINGDKIATNTVATMSKLTTSNYLHVGSNSQDGNWPFKSQKNAWFYKKLGVSGYAEFRGAMRVSGYRSSSYKYSDIWGYHDGENWGGLAFSNSGAYSGRKGSGQYTHLYVYGKQEHRGGALEVNGYIMTTRGMYSNSDRRIKTNIVDVSDISSLERVLAIPVRNYQYKNKFERGTMNVTGYIAQEVNASFPEAVSSKPGWIPYVDEVLTVLRIQEDRFTLAYAEKDEPLIPGDLLRCVLHFDESVYDKDIQIERREMTVEEINVDENKMTLVCKDCVQTDEATDAILIQEKHIDDLLAIDKQRIYALHHGAIQELHRKQELLKERIQKLEELNQQLISRLEVLESK